MMNTSMTRWFFCALLGLGLSACTASDLTAQSAKIGVGDVCSVDSDCNDGLECEHAQCKEHGGADADAGAACVADTDCATGQECDDGACKDHHDGEANDDGGADDGEADGGGADDGDHHDGEGDDDAVSCTADTDCATGETCDAGECEDHHDGQADDGDHHDGEDGDDDGDHHGGEGDDDEVSCTVDTDCAAGQTCDDGECEDQHDGEHGDD